MTKEQKIKSLRNAIDEKKEQIKFYKKRVQEMNENKENPKRIKSREKQIEDLQRDIERFKSRLNRLYGDNCNQEFQNVKINTCRGEEEWSSIDSAIFYGQRFHLMENDKLGDEVPYIIMCDKHIIHEWNWYDTLQDWFNECE